MEYGALGLIAASEVSYSFVNDTYVWGLYDYMFPDFLPQFGPTITEQRGMLPAFANVAAKYFLQASNWPYNEGNKEVTYNLFHHHGCAFQSIYSEVPQDLLVLHDNVLLTGAGSFSVTADSGSFIALSHNGEILVTAESDGTMQNMQISPLIPEDILDVVVTKQNYFRYHAQVDVIATDMPYVVYNEYIINDTDGNNDGILDYGESVLLSLTLENVGLLDATSVDAEIYTNNNFVGINESTAFFGDIAAQTTASVTDGYAFETANYISDGELVSFSVEATDGDSTWNSYFIIEAHAPVMEYLSFSFDDAIGNGNGRLDPGETAEITVDISNVGSSEAINVEVLLYCDGDFVSVANNPQLLGNMAGQANGSVVFEVYASEDTPDGFNAIFTVEITADKDISGTGAFDLVVGQYSALILDLDPNNFSGPVMMEALNDLDLIADYTTTWPDNLGLYKSLFIPLGIIFSGHQLTNLESTKLIQYLNNGGNLYLEGRRTWYDDPQTAVHHKFNIDVVVDTWFKYDTLIGVGGTFTEDMFFTYNGVSPLNDYYMVPEGSAFSVMTSPDPEYAHVVAYDEGSYKTIGCSFEFGSLLESENPSTRARLMYEYLNFFGDIVTSIPEEGNTATSASLGKLYPNPFSNQTTISFSLEENMPVSIEIYSIDGRKVAALTDGYMNAGNHTVSWDGKGLNGNAINSGIYLCRLRTNSVITTKKLIKY